MFSAEQIEKLSKPLDGSKVKTRSQSGMTLSYLEGWQVIEFANEVFGFGGWSRETIQVDCVNMQEKQLRSGKGWGVTYTAKVRITVGDVVREGFGAGSGNDKDLGQAHESAVKEAETDAMKRALMTFGYGFGLALYDKTQSNVDNGATSSPKVSKPASISKPAVDTYDARAEAQKIADYAKKNGLESDDLKDICSDNNLPLGPAKFKTKEQVTTFATEVENKLANKGVAA